MGSLFARGISPKFMDTICKHCAFDCVMTHHSPGNKGLPGLGSKIISTIGTALPRLLAGAALSAGTGTLMFAGSAQAAWTSVANGYACSFRPQNQQPRCTIGEITPSPAVGGDKFLTLLNWDSVPQSNSGNTSDLEFTYQPADLVTPWHVDLDFNPDDNNGGFLAYKIETVGAPFSLVNLISARDDRSTVTKVYGTGWDGTNITGIIDTLQLTTNNADQGLAFGKVLYVKDTWTGQGGTIDNISNEFQQVPGPLPLFGAGAAFGFSRRIRRRIKRARLA